MAPPPSPTALNHLPDHAAHALFHACCASPQYATNLLRHRPFRSAEHLQEASRTVWNALPPQIWTAAFSAHPRLGGDKHRDGLDRAGRWARAEQAVVRAADADLVKEIRALERRYWEKHGFPFVIWVEGRAVEDVRDELAERIENETDQEVFEAAAEQIRIIEARLEKAMVDARSM